MDIRLPQLAEGADSGTVVNLLVQPGDRIEKDQTILEMENQKAVAPIPSTAAGLVTKVHVKPGEVISVGQILISLEESAGQMDPAAPSGGAEPAPPRPGPSVPPSSPAQGPRPSVSGAPPPASPAIRKMARELGVDLARVRGTEPGGRITAADIRSYMAGLQQGRVASVRPELVEGRTSIDFSRWGPVTRRPFTPLRKAIAQAMSESWSRIPHVTQFDEADVSGILRLIEKHGPRYEKEGIRLTMTACIIRALVPVLKKYPQFNASLDEAAGELVLKGYVHLGIAVDTAGGLIVPVLRDADKKEMRRLCGELRELAERTRARRISPEDLRGASFTLSNQGGIGGGHFTPIIHHPEAAILGVGKARRSILPLALSYDHRVVDGADAARFITDLVQGLESFPESEVSG